MLFLLAWLTLAVTPPAAPDTLVVCPVEFRGALAPWETFRRQQGHEIAVINPPSSAAELRSIVRQVATQGSLRYVMLVGDVPTGHDTAAARRLTVPTNYLRAVVNSRWGSEPKIASDVPYVDLNEDLLPDVAIGRIPADSPDELSAVVRKIFRYELQADGPADAIWQRRLHVVAGVGGFGLIADSLIEAAGTSVFKQTVPAGYTVLPTMANPASPSCPPPGQFTPCVCQQMNDGCLAWIYLGHGLPTELDRVRTLKGAEPILSVRDVPQLQCGPHSPVAVMVACYTGAVDAPSDCLGEELVLADNGPVAVIAATRVTMPYGNTVLGCELLRACFGGRQASLGDILRQAQRRTLERPSADDSLRRSIDSLAENLSSKPGDLAAERREHVWMYHLLGDPLVRLRLPRENVASATNGDTTAR